MSRRSARRDTTFDNIVKRELHFPSRGPVVSAEGRDLITRLLTKVGHLLTWLGLVH